MKLSRDDWDIALLRELWSYLKSGITRLNRSKEHESVWYNLAGYVLRPGYGFPSDEDRILELSKLFDLGIKNQKETKVLLQWCILWRRVSGGLSEAEQVALAEKINKLISKDSGVLQEGIRTLSVLEKLPVESKIGILKLINKNLKGTKIDEALAWSFGRISSRVLVDVQDDKIIPPEHVERFFLDYKDFTWDDVGGIALAKSMLLASRISKVKNLNLQSSVRDQIYSKVREAGIPIESLRVLKEFVPLEKSDEKALFGDGLPLGLSLAND